MEKQESEARGLTYTGRKLNSRERDIGYILSELVSDTSSFGLGQWSPKLKDCCFLWVMQNHMPVSVVLQGVFTKKKKKKQAWGTPKKEEICCYSVVQNFLQSVGCDIHHLVESLVSPCLLIWCPQPLCQHGGVFQSTSYFSSVRLHRASIIKSVWCVFFEKAVPGQIIVERHWLLAVR